MERKLLTLCRFFTSKLDLFFFVVFVIQLVLFGLFVRGVEDLEFDYTIVGGCCTPQVLLKTDRRRMPLHQMLLLPIIASCTLGIVS